MLFVVTMGVGLIVRIVRLDVRKPLQTTQGTWPLAVPRRGMNKQGKLCYVKFLLTFTLENLFISLAIPIINSKSTPGSRNYSLFQDLFHDMPCVQYIVYSHGLGLSSTVVLLDQIG